MRKIVCDKCGKELHETGDGVTFTNGYSDICNNYLRGEFVGEINLCTKHFDEFKILFDDYLEEVKTKLNKWLSS